MKKINVAILASGSGSNAENIAKYFKGHQKISVCLILSNKTDAYVLERAKNLNIPCGTFNRSEMENGNLLSILKGRQINYLILAGFLLKIPKSIIDHFQDKIINIHPSLLPKFGGKGMYGDRVHQAVIEAKESESGITIHLVNEVYDEGRILSQHKCPVNPGDDHQTLASKVHQLEYEFFPKVIQNYILEKES